MSRVVQYILVAYFIPNNLYLLHPYPYIAPPLSLSLLVTVSLFSVSVNLLLFFCYIHWFVVCFIFQIYVILYSVCLSLSDLFHLAFLDFDTCSFPLSLPA